MAQRTCETILILGQSRYESLVANLGGARLGHRIYLVSEFGPRV